MSWTLSRLLQLPSITVLALWMIVPLSMTLYFSFRRYHLLYPDRQGAAGWRNYNFFVTDPAFWPALVNTALLVGMILLITVTLGLAIALLTHREFPGRGLVRVMLISPFFIMPTVNAILWKNMLLDPVNGLFNVVWRALGGSSIAWLESYPLASIIIMLSWQWTPFAVLIFITALQSEDREQKEAARIDGAGFWSQLRHLTLPHLARPIAVVILIQMIFHLAIFAEISITTGGGPGVASTNLTFLVYKQALLNFNVGVAAAGGVIAIILANLFSLFLVRIVGQSLENR